MSHSRLVASISVACMLVQTVMGKNTNSSDVPKVVNATNATSEIIMAKLAELNISISPESLDRIIEVMKKDLFGIAKLLALFGHPYAALITAIIAEFIKE